MPGGDKIPIVPVGAPLAALVLGTHTHGAGRGGNLSGHTTCPHALWLRSGCARPGREEATTEWKEGFGSDLNLPGNAGKGLLSRAGQHGARCAKGEGKHACQ